MNYDAMKKSLDLLTYVGSSLFYDKEREVRKIQDNVKKIDKNLIEKCNRVVVDIYLSIYDFAINVMEYLPDSFDESDKFYIEITNILEFKRNYLSKFDQIDLLLKSKIGDRRRKLRDLIQERKDKIVRKYWETHAEEKAVLCKKIKSVECKINEVSNRLHSLRGDNDSVIKGLQKARNASVPSENDRYICTKRIKDMQNEYDSLGIFKLKDKKILSERIDAENCRLKELEEKIRKEKQELTSKIDREIDNLNKESEIIRQEISELRRQEKLLRNELENPRALLNLKMAEI